jgi:hypothetical protein
MNSRTTARKLDRIGYMRAIASKSRVGRIRRAVKRCFILSDGSISIGDVLRRAYPRLQRFTAWHYLAARRALRKEATIIGRNRHGRGRPNLWSPNPTIGSHTDNQ